MSRTFITSASTVCSYSLKQGIHDGFLAPYKVMKVHIDRDIEGYRPEPGKVDRDGKEVEDRIYNQTDFDRTLVIDDRTKVVARKVSTFLAESRIGFRRRSSSASTPNTRRACVKR
jgi:type I restriction enzyme, R subunit